MMMISPTLKNVLTVEKKYTTNHNHAGTVVDYFC
jgi:hypothetical protein